MRQTLDVGLADIGHSMGHTSRRNMRHYQRVNGSYLLGLIDQVFGGDEPNPEMSLGLPQQTRCQDFFFPPADATFLRLDPDSLAAGRRLPRGSPSDFSGSWSA